MTCLTGLLSLHVRRKRTLSRTLLTDSPKRRLMIPIYLFTYNCGKQAIDSQTLVSGCAKDFPDEVCELYVFALQEMCGIMDGCFYDSANHYAIGYLDVFIRALSAKYSTENLRFKTVGLVHIGAMAMVVISPFASKISRVRTATASCGIGFTSLKGGVGVRLAYKVNDTTTVDISFGAAHLPAHEGNDYYTFRNKVSVAVMRGLDFGDGYGLLKPGSHTFFLGDLNYRTTEKLDPKSPEMQSLWRLQDQLAQQLEAEIPSLVARYDELGRGMARGEVFMGFSEANIDFRPTYKYETHTAIYKRNRAPLWCDRVLYQSSYSPPTSSSSSSIPYTPRIHRYNVVSHILLLDHRPVSLHISLPNAPPDAIVSPGGYQLVIEPNGGGDEVVGPTEEYMKPTGWDRLVNFGLRKVSDGGLGWLLWLVTTRQGRTTLMVAVLVVLGYNWLFP